MPPTYPPIPPRLALAIAWAALCGRRRSFRQDALRLTRRLAFTVHGRENVPSGGPALVVMNHYHRPGFQAYWFTLAISATLPAEAHWTMTEAWTDDGTPGAWWRARLSVHFLPRLAQVYGFTHMPPMPPRPHEVAARAAAVRALIAVARNCRGRSMRDFIQADENFRPAPTVNYSVRGDEKDRHAPTTANAPILALSPEGMDAPGGALMRLHPGAGRLLLLLDGLDYPIYPVGVYETEDALLLSFGAPLRLARPQGQSAAGRDEAAASQVMSAIAALLPEPLRGFYGS